MRTISWFLAVCILSLICCSQKDGVGNTVKDSLIVFFNVKDDYTRMDLANALKGIDSLGPKLIALEVIIDSVKYSTEDSLLATTLSSLETLILSADVSEPDLSIGKTNSFFKRKVFGEGLLSYLVEEDSTTIRYIPLFQNQHEQMLSFPDQIVFNFQPETLYRFREMQVNKAVPIEYSKTLENFHVIDRENWRPELVQDKIIIVAQFGGNDDAFYIPFRNAKIKTYSAVITANVVLEILNVHKKNGPHISD